MTDGLIVQWPDTHVPYMHTGAVASILRFIEEQGPTKVVLTGDFLDCLPVAKWTAGTVEENGKLLEQELEAGKRVLADLRRVHKGEVLWLPGNHEERLMKWGKTRGRGVFGLSVLTIPHLLDFDGFGVTTPGGTVEATGPVRIAPNTVAIHGEKLSQKGGYSVSRELDRFGNQTSLIMGHCHRLALVYRTHMGRRIFGVEGGMLMDQRKAQYLTYGEADWQLGFCSPKVEGKSVVPQLHPMDRKGNIR